MNRWIVIALIGCALAMFGYKVYQRRQLSTSPINRGPVSVAAVRGSSHDSLNPVTAGADSFVDYTQALKDDVSIARRNVDKYNASNKQHLEGFNKDLKESGQ